MAHLKIHVRAPFRLVQQAAPYFRLKPKQREHRSIINVTSTSGLHGNVGQANYAAAKAAEWSPFGVRANTVAFGLTHTRSTASKEAGMTIEIDGKKIENMPPAYDILPGHRSPSISSYIPHTP
ncbi:hypothetical protein BD779DRAFT_1664633 [Infundibulicybe gibba]|nr:hypothetical protein BD779DRAFT_1664633 [Infundibulicybe gibba]